MINEERLRKNIYRNVPGNRWQHACIYLALCTVSQNKQLIEKNMTVKFPEMHGFSYEFQAVLSATLSQHVCFGGHYITPWTN